MNENNEKVVDFSKEKEAFEKSMKQAEKDLANATFKEYENTSEEQNWVAMYSESLRQEKRVFEELITNEKVNIPKIALFADVMEFGLKALDKVPMDFEKEVNDTIANNRKAAKGRTEQLDTVREYIQMLDAKLKELEPKELSNGKLKYNDDAVKEAKMQFYKRSMWVILNPQEK